MTNEEESKKFEVLPGFPKSEEEVVCFGGQPFYSQGLIIRFFKEDGTSWIANISGGDKTILKDTRPLSGGKILALVGYGRLSSAYIFDPDDKSFTDELGYGYYNLLESEGWKVPQN